MKSDAERALDVKRKRLTSILVERAQERYERLRQNPFADVNVREVFEKPDAKQIRRDIARLPESHIDYCLEYYDFDDGPQYVY